MENSKRAIGIERLYSLGEFKNVKFYSSISDIKYPFYLDSDFISSLYALQILNIEKHYRNYLDLLVELSQKDDKDAIEYIENLMESYLGNIKISIEEKGN